jgi:hypothetical protein
MPKNLNNSTISAYKLHSFLNIEKYIVLKKVRNSTKLYINNVNKQTNITETDI